MLFTIPIQLTYSSPGSPGVNVFHCRVPGDEADHEDLNTIIGWLHTFYTTIKNFYPSSMDIDFLGTVKTIETEPRFIAGLDPWHVDGNPASNTMLPVATQICLNWTTATAGRRGRGRTFIGPLNSGGLDTDGSGTPFNDVLNQLGTAALALLQSSTTFNNGALGVYSPTDGLLRDFTGFRVLKKYAILSSRRD